MRLGAHYLITPRAIGGELFSSLTQEWPSLANRMSPPAAATCRVLQASRDLRP